MCGGAGDWSGKGETIFDNGSNRKTRIFKNVFEVKKLFVRKIFSKIPEFIFWNFENLENFENRKIDFSLKIGIFDIFSKISKKTTPENFKNIFRTNNFLTSKYFQIFWFFLFEPSSQIVSLYVWSMFLSSWDSLL